MSINRLSQIEKKLKLLREHKNTFEQETMLTTGLAKVQKYQWLREEIQPQIREYEGELDTEYFLRLHFPKFQQWTQTLGKNS